MRPLQRFSDEYLEQTRKASPEQILEYLESFRLMTGRPGKSRLISIKVPESLLNGFRRRCELENVRYQTRIKQLMQSYLLENQSGNS